jgi:hypothetical protein
VSEIDPADITAVPRRTLSEAFDPDLADAPATSTHRKAEREGLPSGYRMRADAHYVDQLTSRKAEKGQVDAPRSGSKEADATRTEHLLAQLAESLATIESASAILANETSAIARRANLDVIKTHAWRASWLLRANAIAQGSRRIKVRPRPIAFLLGEVRNRFGAECRLAGVSLQVHASDWNAVVDVDEQDFIAGVAGAVFSSIGLVEDADGVTIKVSAVTAGRELRSVEVTQDDVMVAAGDLGAGLAASTARTVAQQHGGEAAFLTAGQGGSTIRLTFSRAN